MIDCVAACQHARSSPGLLTEPRSLFWPPTPRPLPEAAHVPHVPCGCSQSKHSPRSPKCEDSLHVCSQLATEVFKNLTTSASPSCLWNKEQSPVQRAMRSCMIWLLTDHPPSIIVLLPVLWAPATLTFLLFLNPISFCHRISNTMFSLLSSFR